MVNNINFVNECHARGIAVVQDVVHNHYGPSDLDTWRVDGWYQNNLGGIYFYTDWRSSTPWGDTRPDYGRGEVRTFIRDNCLNWLQEYRIDGLRWDSTVNIRNSNIHINNIIHIINSNSNTSNSLLTW